VFHLCLAEPLPILRCSSSSSFLHHAHSLSCYGNGDPLHGPGVVNCAGRWADGTSVLRHGWPYRHRGLRPEHTSLHLVRSIYAFALLEAEGVAHRLLSVVARVTLVRQVLPAPSLARKRVTPTWRPLVAAEVRLITHPVHLASSILTLSSTGMLSLLVVLEGHPAPSRQAAASTRCCLEVLAEFPPV
jgi:hypothetical protein